MEWEYFVLKIGENNWLTATALDPAMVSEKLNELGKQGWELVSGLDINKTHGASESYVFIFKRPRGPIPPPVQAR